MTAHRDPRPFADAAARPAPDGARADGAARSMRALAPARRRLGLLATAAVVALAGCAEPATTPPRAAEPGDTRASTLRDRDGDGRFVTAPGERVIDRTELAPSARGPLKEIARLGILSDPHVADEESPTRLGLLDRLGGALGSSARPQEALTPHVLDAAVRALRADRPDAVLALGDLAESGQRNELRWVRRLLDGGPLTPDSGAPGYDGLQEASNPDPFLYRPDVDAPRYPGLLERAQRPFAATGFGDIPVLPALGNHDALLSGTLAPTPTTERIATGPLVPADAAALADAARRVGEAGAGAGDDLAGAEGLRSGRPGRVAATIEELLRGGIPGRTASRPADPDRVTPSARAAAAILTELPLTAGRLDYTYDVGDRVRVVVLDLVSRDGGSGAESSTAQQAWLERELERARAAARLVLVASHQPLPAALAGPLGAQPHVLAVLAGHMHRHEIEPRAGVWSIVTAALVDFPQQARGLRVLQAADGSVALETYAIDHRGAPDGSDLAGAARRLAALDAQGGRPAAAAGDRGDRNARLWTRARLPR